MMAIVNDIAAPKMGLFLFHITIQITHKCMNILIVFLVIQNRVIVDSV